MRPLLSHLISLEITSPDVAASVRFFEARLGLRVIDRRGDKVYLRCWGDHYRYSLVVSPGASAGLADMAWRTQDEASLDELARRVEAAGVTGTWHTDDHDRGRTYSFVGPYGHRTSLVWDVTEHVAEPGFESAYPDRPERRSSHAAAPRHLDHVTIAASDVRGFAQWYSEVLGYRVMAFTDLEDAPVTVFSVLTTNETSHDLGIVLDTSDTPGRVHHIAFWADHPEDLHRAADLLVENGTPIEYGPSQHGIGELRFLYFREPGTMRVELNSGGYRNYVPDWRPRDWRPSQGSNHFYRNWDMPDSMMDAFPPAAGMTATEDGAPPALHKALANPWASTSPKNT
jgi:catechol 2,3-dioxygenase